MTVSTFELGVVRLLVQLTSIFCRQEGLVRTRLPRYIGDEFQIRPVQLPSLFGWKIEVERLRRSLAQLHRFVQMSGRAVDHRAPANVLTFPQFPQLPVTRTHIPRLHLPTRLRMDGLRLQPLRHLPGMAHRLRKLSQ